MSNKKNTPMEEEAEIFEFQDEDGNIEKFEILDYIEYDNRDFAILLPVSEKEEEVQVHVLEVIEELDSDYDTYVGIEDQELVDKVYNIFMEKHKDDFNFID